MARRSRLPMVPELMGGPHGRMPGGVSAHGRHGAGQAAAAAAAAAAKKPVLEEVGKPRRSHTLYLDGSSYSRQMIYRLLSCLPRLYGKYTRRPGLV